MWLWTADKCAKFHIKRLNRSENIPKSLGGMKIENSDSVKSQSVLVYKLHRCVHIVLNISDVTYCRSEKL